VTDYQKRRSPVRARLHDYAASVSRFEAIDYLCFRHVLAPDTFQDKIFIAFVRADRAKVFIIARIDDAENVKQAGEYRPLIEIDSDSLATDFFGLKLGVFVRDGNCGHCCAECDFHVNSFLWGLSSNKPHALD
jgi:hypothetical protein